MIIVWVELVAMCFMVIDQRTLILCNKYVKTNLLLLYCFSCPQWLCVTAARNNLHQVQVSDIDLAAEFHDTSATQQVPEAVP